MNRQAIKLAVIGTGAIAQVAHLPILARMRGVELVGVQDIDPAKARTIAERFGIKRVYRTLADALADAELDGVVICTPSHLHEEQVIASLESGKYVFCERPLTVTVEGVRRVVGMKEAATHLQIGMNQRFRPDAIALKAFVSGGELGQIQYIRAGWLNRRVDKRQRTWRHRKTDGGGGALMDLGLQMLDLALWLLDYPEPRRVVAHLHRPSRGEVEDSAVMLLRTARDSVVNLEVTWNLLADRDQQYLNVHGTAGTGSLSPLRVFKEMDGGLRDTTPQITAVRENQYTATYRQELAHFAGLVRSGRRGERPNEQVTLLRIIEAAYQSAEEGAEIHL